MFPIRDHNPSGRTPYVNYTLIAINIAVFLVTLTVANDPQAQNMLYYQYAMIPARMTQEGTYFSIFTSMFMHAGLMHIAGNMLFLWIFGDNMEDKFGHVGYLAFYLATGIGAGLVHYLASPLSQVPTVGASGAIAGVMGGYLLLFPKARVDILFIIIVIIKIITIPAWIMLGLWFGLQLFNGVGSDPNAGGVAYWAHAGGFIVGVLFTLPIFLRLGGPDFWARNHGKPPHHDAEYEIGRTRIPKVRRK